MKIFAKTIRIITVAPLAAAALIMILYCTVTGAFTDYIHLATAILTLCIMPLTAYPISLIWNKSVRRSRQRKLAIILSVAGYIAGFVFAMCSQSTVTEKVLYGTYLISGALIAASTFVFHIKCSGHACGIAGPIVLLSFDVSPWFALGFVLLIPVFWSSLKIKRHTPAQLISGAVVPALAFLISSVIFRAF